MGVALCTEMCLLHHNGIKKIQVMLFHIKVAILKFAVNEL